MFDALHILLDKSSLKNPRKISIFVSMLQIKPLKLKEIKVTKQADVGMMHSKDLIQSLTPKPTCFLFTKSKSGNHFLWSFKHF